MTSQKTRTKIKKGSASIIAETAYYRSDLKDAKKKMEEAKAKSPIYNKKAYSIISFVLAIIPVLLGLCYQIARSIDKSQIGSKEFREVDLLLPVYYWTVGIIFTVASIGFGIAGLRTKLKVLAIISLSIKAVTMIVAAFIVL